MEMKKTAVSGFFWRFSERFLAQIISFIVSIILARILSPKEYGLVSLVMIFITIANVLTINGFATPLVQKKNSDELDFSTILVAGLCLSVLVYMIIFFIAPLLSKTYKNSQLTAVLRVMALRIPIASFNSVQQAYVQKNMIFKKFFYSTLFGTLISGVVGIAMAINGGGVWALVTQYLTNSFTDTIILFFTIDWKPSFSFSLLRFKKLYSYGWKIMCTSLIGTLFEQLKVMIIGIKYTTEDLAFFNRSEQIPALIVNNINSTIDSVIFPIIAQQQDNLEVVKNTIKRNMKTVSYILMPAMFGIAATADTLVRVLLTDKWLPCIPYIRLLSIQYCFSVLSTTNLQVYKAIGRSDISLKLEFVKKPVYLLCILMSMRIGPLAIAASTAFYSMIGIVFNAYPCKKIIDYGIVEQAKDIAVNLVISILMALIVFLIGKLPLSNIALLVQIVSGIVFYVAISILLKLDSFKYIINIIKIFISTKRT